MTMSVNGKVGLVTGAGSGLGEAGAKRLAREGAKLIVADRDNEAIERVASEIAAAGGNATPFVADVSEASFVTGSVYEVNGGQTQL
jgi:NADP-dependent 3-hydroxy acid dehydrogenase YdfG